MKTLKLLSAALLAPVLLGHGLPLAQADEFPSRPIRFVIATAAGGGTDAVGRLIAKGLSDTLKQPLIVDNKAGAAGMIGSEFVARAAPDGYTLILSTVGTMVINKTMYPSAKFDTINDFTPITFIGQTPTLLVVKASAGYRSVANLVETARKSPNAVSYASAGSGTSGHIASTLLGRLTQAKMLHVPYKEGPQALLSTINGEVDFMFFHPVAVMGAIESGKLRALAVSSRKRTPSAPTVPTMEELGYRDFDLTAWYMLAAPARLPPAIIAKIQDAMAQVLANPVMAEKLAQLGIETGAVRKDSLRLFLATEDKKWGDLVRFANAQNN